MEKYSFFSSLAGKRRMNEIRAKAKSEREKGREGGFSIIRCFIEFSFLQRYGNTKRIIRSVLFRLKWEKNEIRHVFEWT